MKKQPFFTRKGQQPPNRLIIYAKDVESITGRRYRTAAKLLQDIRTTLGKQTYQPITIREFCDYTGMSHDDVLEFLG